MDTPPEIVAAIKAGLCPACGKPIHECLALRGIPMPPPFAWDTGLIDPVNLLGDTADTPAIVSPPEPPCTR